jgi:hypothetical protein
VPIEATILIYFGFVVRYARGALTRACRATDSLCGILRTPPIPGISKFSPKTKDQERTSRCFFSDKLTQVKDFKGEVFHCKSRLRSDWIIILT